MKAFIYGRVSTTEQGTGLSLAWQRQRCMEEVAHRGWNLVDSVSDMASGKDMHHRVGLSRLLDRLRAGEGDALVVARLDRLTRHTGDFYALMDQASKEGWSIVVLDPMVDMTSPFGRAMAGVAAVFSQLEREMISQRQRESVAARKAAGTYRPSPRTVSPVSTLTIQRMKTLRKQGLGWLAIAGKLTIEGHPPPRGDRWHPKTVARIVQRES